MPSRQATARVPVLLERLKEFRANVNPQLKVMGVIANRTFGATLTNGEQTRLSALRDQCLDVWGEQVPLFDTHVPQSIEIREAEHCTRPLGPDDASFQTFVELAKEVESRLPTFCRPNVAPKAEGVLS